MLDKEPEEAPDLEVLTPKRPCLGGGTAGNAVSVLSSGTAVLSLCSFPWRRCREHSCKGRGLVVSGNVSMWLEERVPGALSVRGRGLHAVHSSAPATHRGAEAAFTDRLWPLQRGSGYPAFSAPGSELPLLSKKA